MTDKVCRFMLGDEDKTVRVVVSLVFTEDATEETVAQVMTEAMVHGVDRFVNGPHENAGRLPD